MAEPFDPGLSVSGIAPRHAVMRAAVARNPDRFVHGEPKLATLPEAVWIDPPAENSSSSEVFNPRFARWPKIDRSPESPDDSKENAS